MLHAKHNKCSYFHNTKLVIWLIKLRKSLLKRKKESLDWKTWDDYIFTTALLLHIQKMISWFISGSLLIMFSLNFILITL